MTPSPGHEPTRWFALAAEDEGHRDAVARLTDRVLAAKVEWFQPETRDELRGWRGPGAQPYWPLKSALASARELRLPTRGHFGDGPKKPEAGMIRAQLFLWKRSHERGERIDVGFIARDTDHAARIEGAEQAVGDRAWPFRIVLAYPEPEIEAWLIAGFEAATEEERARVTDCFERLGFSPIEKPEQLTSTVPGADTDAKRVLDLLVAGDPDRKRACLEGNLDALRARGQRCNLARFLDAVETEVVPLFCEVPAPASAVGR